MGLEDMYLNASGASPALALAAPVALEADSGAEVPRDVGEPRLLAIDAAWSLDSWRGAECADWCGMSTSGSTPEECPPLEPSIHGGDVGSGECRRGRFVGGSRGISPGIGGRGGPRRNDATACEAASYGPFPAGVLNTVGSDRNPSWKSSRRRFPVAATFGDTGAEEGGAAPTRFKLMLEGGGWARPLPLLPIAGMSLSGVQSCAPSPSTPSTGGSRSMSRIMLMSTTTSPATAQPAMPYPPARTEGERPCARQKRMTALTSTASRGETSTRHEGLSLPLNVRARSGYLVAERRQCEAKAEKRILGGRVVARTLNPKGVGRDPLPK